MGRIQVTGDYSGRTYDIGIDGDAPTATETQRIQQMLYAQEEAFRRDYEARFGVDESYDVPGALARGIDRGQTTSYSALGTTARDIGETTGIDFLRTLGQGMEERARLEQIAEAGRLPAPTRMEDIGTVGQALTWLGEGAGQSVPEMGATLGATFLGGVFGNAPGAIAAGTATAMPFFYGRNVQRQEGEVAAGGLEDVDRLNAFLAAGGQSLLNSVGDKILLTGRALGLSIPASRNLFTRIAQQGAAGGAVEAPTEIMQQVLERAQAGLPLDSDDAIQEYIEAGVLGGLIGAGVRGGLAPLAAPPSDDTAPPAGGAPTPSPTAPTPAPTPTPTVTAEAAGLTAEDLAFEGDAEAEPDTPSDSTPAPSATEEAVPAPTAATPVARTKALLGALGLPPRLDMWGRLETLGVAPESLEVRSELERLLPLLRTSEKFGSVRRRDPGLVSRVEAWLASPMAAPAAPAPSTESRGLDFGPEFSPAPAAPRVGEVAPEPTTDFETDADAFERAGREAETARRRGSVSTDSEVVDGGPPGDTDTAESATPDRDGVGSSVPGPAESAGRAGAQQPALTEQAQVSEAPSVDLELEAEMRAEREAIQAEGETPALTDEELVGDIPFDDTPIPEGLPADPFAEYDPPIAPTAAQEVEALAAKARSAKTSPAQKAAREVARERALVTKADAARAAAIRAADAERAARLKVQQEEERDSARRAKAAQEVEALAAKTRAAQETVREVEREIAETDVAGLTQSERRALVAKADAARATAISAADAERAARLKVQQEEEREAARRAKAAKESQEQERGAPTQRPAGAAPATLTRGQATVQQGQLVPEGDTTLTRAEELDASMTDAEQELIDALGRALTPSERALLRDDPRAARFAEQRLAAKAAEDLRASWDARWASKLTPQILDFFTPETRLKDPSTSGDRRAVIRIIDKATGAGGKGAQKIFSRYPSVVEALDVIAEMTSRQPRLTTRINKLKEAAPEEFGTLEGHGLADGFLEAGVTVKDAEGAAKWVRANLSTQASDYLQGKQVEYKEFDKNVHKRTGKHDPVAMARLPSDKEIEDTNTLLNRPAADRAVENLTAAAEAVKGGAAAEDAVRDAAMSNAESSTKNRLSTALDSTFAGPSDAVVVAERKELLATPGRMRSWNKLQRAVGMAYPDLVATRKDADALLDTLSDEEILEVMEDKTVADNFLKLSRRFKAIRQDAAALAPLSAMAKRALLAGNLRGALADIVAKSPDKEIRAVARVILRNIGDTKVFVYDPANPDLEPKFRLESDRGAYFPTEDTITLNEFMGMDVQTLLHEAAHAVTYKYFAENPNSALATDLKMLFAQHYDAIIPYLASVSPRADGRTPLFSQVTQTELLEFVAELRTNMPLRARLRALSTEGSSLPRKSLAANLLQWAEQVFRKVMKKLGAGQRDVVTLADRAIDNIMTPRRAAGDVLFAKATRPGTGNSAIARILRPVTSRALTPKYREKFADTASELLSTASGATGKTMLGFLPQLAVGDLADKVGIENPYAMPELARQRDAALARETGDVDILMDRAAKLNTADPEQYRRLGGVVTAATVEGVDLALNPTVRAENDLNLTKFWLAFDKLDKDGNIVSTQRRYFDTMSEREAAIEALNKTPVPTRSKARHAGNKRDADELAIVQAAKDEYAALSPEAKNLYTALRDFYEQKYDRMWALLQGEIDGLLAGNPVAAATAKRSIYVKLFDKGQIRPYFPLVREGDYWLEFSVYNPATKSTEPVKQTFETKGARQRMIDQLDSVPGVVKDADGNVQTFMYTASQMSTPSFRTDALFVRDVMKVFEEHNAAADPDKRIGDDVMTDIAAIVTKSAPEGAIARQLHKRNNTAGYSEDIMAGLREKGYRISQAAPKLAYSRAIRSLQKTYRENIPKNPDAKQVAVLEELVKIGDVVLNPMDSPADQAAQIANRVAYAYTLLGNLSSVLVNTSSMANVVYPQVGGRYGYNKAAGSLTRMTKLFFGSGFKRIDRNPVLIGGEATTEQRALPSIDNYYILQADGSFVVDPARAMTARQRAALENMAPLVRMMSEQGLLHHSLHFDSAGIEDSSHQRGVVSRIFAMFGAPFHVVERMTRQTTAMSVYELELAKLRAEERARPTGRSDAELQQAAAAEGVYQAQNLNGGASLNTAPRFAQRGLGRVALMYKSYGITVTTLLFKTARQIVINSFPGASPEAKAERDIAMRQMMGHLGATFVMAGVAGLPMYGLASMIGNLLRDEDEISFDEATRLQLSEFMYKGPINALTGFEVSSRTGLAGVLYRANPYMQDATAEEHLVTLLGGPAWSIGTQARRAVRDLRDGEYWRGLEGLTPLAVSNLLRAARFAREGGAMTRADNFIYEDMTTSEILGRAIGFNPAELVRRQARTSEAVRIGRVVQERRTRLVERLFLAYRSGDIEGANEVLEDIAEFNDTVARRYPDTEITDTSIDDSFDRREDVIEDMMNGVSVNPQVRDVLVQQMGAIYDGLTSL